MHVVQVTLYKCSERLVCFSFLHLSSPSCFLLYYFAVKKDFFYSSLFQILFPGSFIFTLHPVISALLRSLMSETLRLILFCREQGKAGYCCAGHGILWELWSLGEESRGIKRREGSMECVHRKPKMKIPGRRDGEVASSRIPDCWAVWSKIFIVSWDWWNLNCTLSRRTSTLMKGIDTVSSFFCHSTFLKAQLKSKTRKNIFIATIFNLQFYSFEFALVKGNCAYKRCWTTDTRAD